MLLRCGADAECAQALTGGAVAVTTLDDRVLSVALEEIVTPGLVMRVSEEGLPLPGGGKVGAVQPCIYHRSHCKNDETNKSPRRVYKADD
jgi:DnaJ-class molecular chaperone